MKWYITLGSSALRIGLCSISGKTVLQTNYSSNCCKKNPKYKSKIQNGLENQAYFEQGKSHLILCEIIKYF